MNLRASDVLVAGSTTGSIVVLAEPLSFWGGVDPHSGDIIEARHPQYGRSLAGAILAMPHERGSSSASSVLAETLRAGVGPNAIITREATPILALGSMVAAELYPDRVCPVLAVGDGYDAVVGAGRATIHLDGTVELSD